MQYYLVVKGTTFLNTGLYKKKKQLKGKTVIECVGRWEYTKAKRYKKYGSAKNAKQSLLSEHKDISIKIVKLEE